ncbi:MAG TPA: BatA domain-containing protein, partial [Acidimicrobiales bacterium]|nr:BatA domain-containing protein [Acidimicrobiales bacterium]
MIFTTPLALAGLVLAGIPIILHLLARREPPTVVFPATRYLADATRLHQRRLQLEHLVLLVLRTLLIVALVLAAAGPRWPKAGLGAHPPAALVLVLDNSLSSGAIQGGVPVLDGLVAAARAVLDRATPDDQLWLITADGVPRAGTAAALAAQLDSVGPSSHRLDLGAVVARASDIVTAQALPGEIVVVSDLQRSALAGSVVSVPMTVLRPAEPPPANAGLSTLTVGAQPWGADGGTVGITVTGVGTAPRPVTVVAGSRPVRQLLVPVGGQGTHRIAGLPAGWWAVEAELDPDELRADDARRVAVRVAPAARVQWSVEDRFIATAAEVLVQNGRIVPGGEVALGPVTAGASVVIPPRDPAGIGAVNRALAARGSSWRYGDLTVLPTATDSGPWVGRVGVSRRYRLTFQGGAPTDVLVTAGGEPWMVRSGRLVLIASRLVLTLSGAPVRTLRLNSPSSVS